MKTTSRPKKRVVRDYTVEEDELEDMILPDEDYHSDPDLRNIFRTARLVRLDESEEW